MHKLMCILIHSSFCVLNFVLPARRPNFAKVDRTPQKVKLTCFFCVLKTWSICKSCSLVS